MSHADDTHAIACVFRIDHCDDSNLDLADGNKPLLTSDIDIVEHIQNGAIREKEGGTLLKREAMLLAIDSVLVVIPLNMHTPLLWGRAQLSQWTSRTVGDVTALWGRKERI